ncbi:hypothetical protein BCV70DRAFT_202196 [Testicularia cyperi]|uniref:DnaJ homologue subfamily C member 28 conserved domain-containing protein n=1 Tax=Testicularia cyperi TaxID=1882483 RepID=A0A317XJL4_9BASI|nr:hypothetical protein BCV70DRAFT_202196 [Testicularia cyperi]
MVSTASVSSRRLLGSALAGPSRSAGLTAPRASPGVLSRASFCTHPAKRNRSAADLAQSADTNRNDATASSPEPNDRLTGADKLLQDALRLEAEEEAALDRRSRAQDPNDPVWTGEERVQDTVLRMVMDKYKPLRIKTDDGVDPADQKLKSGIQQPSAPGGSSSDAPWSTITGNAGDAPEHEDGRRLPKTPDQKPWRAVYVRPSHLLGAGSEDTPSVYYGQFLKSSHSAAAASTPGSDIRAKLKSAGVNVAALPLDNPKAMQQLRQGVKAAERRGKLLRARDSVIDYQLAKPMTVASPTEDPSNDPNLQLQLGQARGWASVVEERIKAAQDAGLFRENKLRGQPIKRDIEERNPFLGREEYFMNRIVKRQGAAPPWVELNMELEEELRSWRDRMVDGWVRRASRMITTSTTLREGMDPLPPAAADGPNAVPTDGSVTQADAAQDGAGMDPTIDPTAKGAESKLVLEVPAARTPGEQRLIDVATRYRDPEWEVREQSFHQHELKRLNDLIRKHNHLAPFTARKGLLTLDLELKSMYTRALPLLVNRISNMLEEQRNPSAKLKRASIGYDPSRYESGPVTYDIWGREIRSSSSSASSQSSFAGWFGNAVGDKSDNASSNSDGRYMESGYGAGKRRRSNQSQGLGLLVAIRKSVEWARERIGV